MIRLLISKSLTELRRDPLLLVLTLICAPFFVLLYKLIFLEGMTVYDILLLPADPNAVALVEDFQNYAEAIRYPGGGTLFRFSTVVSRDAGLSKLRDREARLMASFSLNGDIVLTGDHSDPYYVLASKLLTETALAFAQDRLGFHPPVHIREEALGISARKTEFENYVPGLVIFSTLVLIYLYVLILAREVESRVFVRYRLCGLRSRDYVLGHTTVFLGLSTGAALLALIVAFALGFQSPLSPWRDVGASLLICAVISLAAAGVAFLVTAFASDVVHAFLISTFPFMVLVFFSGSVYPFPKIPVARIAGRTIGLFDVLPSTHAVTALHKILTFGVGVGDLGYELTGLTVLSLGLFVLGATIFGRRRLGTGRGRGD